MPNALFVTMGPFYAGGVLLDAARLYHYQSGTTTLKNIWADRLEGFTLAQPFVSDANGRFAFFGDGLYKLVVTDQNDQVLYTWNDVMLQDPQDPGLSMGAPITIASVLNVGPETIAHLTGSGTINTLAGTIPFFWGIFDGNVTLTASGNLVTPHNVDWHTDPEDVVFFINEGAGIWRIGGTCSNNFVADANGATLNNGPLTIAAGGLAVTGDFTTLNRPDNRTNTVATPVTVGAVTSSAAAAGIGTGLILQAESADESPSNFGQIQAVASDITAGSEDTYWELLTRVGGAALAAIYRFGATTGFRAIFTHANSADRIYTWPNVAGTVVLHGQADVGTADLKTSTGSATGATPGADVSLNDYSFFPSLTVATGTAYTIITKIVADPTNTVGVFNISDLIGTGGAWTVRWRYVTASDDPTIWVLVDAGGSIVGVWASDDPVPGNQPGIGRDGCNALLLKSADLESWTVLSGTSAAAADQITAKRMKMQHQAYRALQLMTNDLAPSQWILKNCLYKNGTITHE